MGLGMPEVVLILVIALIVFGPRKLPDLGKSLGQAMGQFRKASDEFKRTWEQEVELENVRKSDTPSIGSGSSDTAYGGYDSNHHGDGSYGTDPDYNYGYDTNNQDSLSAAEPASSTDTEAALPAAAAETVAEAAQPEKQAEKHWI